MVIFTVYYTISAPAVASIPLYLGDMHQITGYGEDFALYPYWFTFFGLPISVLIGLIFYSIAFVFGSKSAIYAYYIGPSLLIILSIVLFTLAIIKYQILGYRFPRHP